MRADGYVKMSVILNVIGLETDSIKIDEYGEVSITDPEQFFADWVDEWNNGNGELAGANDISVELDAREEELER